MQVFRMFARIKSLLGWVPEPATDPRSTIRESPAPATAPPITEKEWRKIKSWSKSARDELKEHVANLAPETAFNVKVPFFNIVLTGQIGAGKSSFYNSLNNLFTGRIIAGKANTGQAAESLTKEYRVYEIKPSGPNTPSLRWRICDTMGLEPGRTTESGIRNILKAVDGHVPDRHIFSPGTDFNDKSVGYIQNPTLAEKAHCIAVVIDASKVGIMSEEMWKKLRSLREGLISWNIPTYIILSHIDEACQVVYEDVAKVYKSVKVRNIVSKVGKQLMGLPENQIFPVKNYKTEVDLDDDMDILLLYAMRQMLYSCQGHIENKM